MNYKEQIKKENIKNYFYKNDLEILYPLNCNITIYTYIYCFIIINLLNSSKSNLKLKQQLKFHKNNGSSSIGVISS